MEASWDFQSVGKKFHSSHDLSSSMESEPFLDETWKLWSNAFKSRISKEIEQEALTVP